jgi:hypothetical protein
MVYGWQFLCAVSYMLTGIHYICHNCESHLCIQGATLSHVPCHLHSGLVHTKNLLQQIFVFSTVPCVQSAPISYLALWWFYVKSECFLVLIGIFSRTYSRSVSGYLLPLVWLCFGLVVYITSPWSLVLVRKHSLAFDSVHKQSLIFGSVHNHPLGFVYIILRFFRFPFF